VTGMKMKKKHLIFASEISGSMNQLSAWIHRPDMQPQISKIV